MARLLSRHDPAHDVEEPLDLLTIGRLEDLPVMQAVIKAKAPLSTRLDALDAELRESEQRLSLYSQKENAGSFQVQIDGLAVRIATLATERGTVLADLESANERIVEARERARRDIMPAVSDLALPFIRGRMEVLDILAVVQRLIVPKSTAYLPARQILALERDYLHMLLDVLDEGTV